MESGVGSLMFLRVALPVLLVGWPWCLVPGVPNDRSDGTVVGSVRIGVVEYPCDVRAVWGSIRSINQRGIEHRYVEPPSSVLFSVSGGSPEGISVSSPLLAFELSVPVYESRFLLQLFEFLPLKWLAGGP